MKTKLTLLTLAATLFTAAPSPATVEDQIALRQLASRLAETIVAYEARNWDVRGYDPSWVNNGGYVQYTMRLNAGEEVIFRGMGDRDALDLDLTVFGPAGRVVAKDTDYDAAPLVKLSVSRSGTYIIRLSIEACTTNGSYVALVIADR